MYLLIPIFGSAAFLVSYLTARGRNRTAWRPQDIVLVVWGLLYTLVFMITLALGMKASDELPSPAGLLVAAACWAGLPGTLTAILLHDATATKFVVWATLVATLLAGLVLVLPLDGLQPFLSVVVWNVGVAVAVLGRPWNNADPESVVMRRQSCCETCGYDLTGNVTGVCPECGVRRVPAGSGKHLA